MNDFEALTAAFEKAKAKGDKDAAKRFAAALVEFEDSPETTAPKTSSGFGLNLAREALQGLTLNTSDEIGAGIAAGVASIKDGAPFKTTYMDMLRDINSEQDAFRSENPKTALAAQIGGGIATGAAGLAKLSAKTAGLPVLKRIASNAGLGAAEGAIAGAGGAQGEDRVSSGVAGAGIGAALGVAGGELVNVFKAKSAVKKEVEGLLKSGSTDSKVAGYILNGSGKVRKDKIALNAISQGVDDGVVAAIKGSSRADKSNMMKMLTVLERGKNNARYGALNRPTDVIGDSIVQRINVVSKAGRRAGAQIDSVAKSLKGKAVDFSSVVDKFNDSLDEIGVKLVTDIDGVIKPDYASSIVRKNPAARRLINNIVDEMQSGGPVDGFRAHQVKKIIDDQVVFGKSKTGLGGKAERIIKNLRREIDQSLDNNFPEYKQVNDIYSETRGILDSIQDVAGKKIDIHGKNSEKALGTLSRSFLSNIRSRANLINAIDDLDNAAAKYGGKFDDDIITQVLFADELDSLFGAAAKSSLQGEVQKAGEKAVRSGLREAVVDTVSDNVHKLKGVNEENAIKALKMLLKDVPGKELAP